MSKKGQIGIHRWTVYKIISPSGRKWGDFPGAKKVVCDNFGLTFSSTSEAGEKLGINPNLISRICSGVRTNNTGLSLRYAV